MKCYRLNMKCYRLNEFAKLIKGDDTVVKSV